MPDIFVAGLVKGKERYLFLFHANRRDELLRTFGRWASNSQLSLTWYDAAVLSKQVRELLDTPHNDVTSARMVEPKQVEPTPWEAWRDEVQRRKPR